LKNSCRLFPVHPFTDVPLYARRLTFYILHAVSGAAYHQSPKQAVQIGLNKDVFCTGELRAFYLFSYQFCP